MASDERKKLELWLKPLLKEAQFRKQGPTWHRNNSETIQVFNIQGSQWGKCFYINLGIYFKEIGTLEKPKEYECHIKMRLDGTSEELDLIESTLDFENNVNDETREKNLQMLVTKNAIPWFDQCQTVKGAKRFLLEEERVGVAVRPVIWENLD